MVNVDAVLVLQRSDVARIAAQPARYEGVRLLFVDPGLLDEAAVRGLQNFEFRRLAVGPDFQARAATLAMARATHLDLLLTQERDRLWPGPALQGWDVGIFFLALQRAAVAQQLGALIERSFPEPRIGLLRPSVPQQMYFDSFMSPDLVARDAARFAIVDSYAEARWHQPQAYEQIFDAPAIGALMATGRVSAITHVPTCFYDRAWLAEEVSRAHPYTVDLPSPIWDVPLHRGPALLRRLDELPRVASADAYRERAARILEESLGDLLPQPLARQQQIDAWATRCHWQAHNYLALREALAGTRPHFLLSDQDTGSNGPLFSVADALAAPLTVVPHSGYPSTLLPHARRVTAVERAGYGTQPRSVLGQSVAVRPVRHAARSQRREHARVSKVCLLLNSMQTEGLSYVDAYALAAFYKPLAALCEAADVELILRPKPGAPALSVLAGALGVAPDRLVQHVSQPLEQLAQVASLCLAYGEPTTGVAPFLEVGSLVLQVGEQLWPSDYVVCLPLIKDGVIALHDHRAALDTVRGLLADPAHYRACRQAQNDAFDRRCAGAHEHLFS